MTSKEADTLIELSDQLHRQIVDRVIEEVDRLSGNCGTAFYAGWSSACEEIQARLKDEWKRYDDGEYFQTANKTEG